MRGAGPGDEADGSAGPGDEADGAPGRETRQTGRRVGRQGRWGRRAGDEADGAPGRETRQMGTPGRGRGGRGAGILYLFG